MYQVGSMALPVAGAGQEGLCPLQGSKQKSVWCIASQLSVAVSLLITKATKLPSHSATPLLLNTWLVMTSNE